MTLVLILSLKKSAHLHIRIAAHKMELSEDLQDRVDLIKHKLKFIDQKPTVACIAALEPLILAGNNIPGLVDIAGGASILTATDKPPVLVQWEDIRQQNPDIIIVMPQGFAIERTMKELNLLLQLPVFTELKAVKNNRLYIANAEAYFNLTESGMVESLEILAEIINPKQFIFGYEGNGWIKFSL